MEHELHKLRIEKQHRAPRNQRSVWPWVALCILLSGVAVAAWQFHTASAAAVVQTVRVQVPEPGAARADDDVVALTATGYIIAAHKIELASKVIGRVAWVGVEMGDRIKKGEILVRLEDDEYRARVAQAQGLLDNAKAHLAEARAGSRPQEIGLALANLNHAKAELTNVELNCNRLHDLQMTGSVSRQQIDDAESLVLARKAAVEAQQQQYELAKAGPRQEVIDAQAGTVRQLKGSLALATVDLDDTIIRAPIASTVLERNVEVGEFVTNGFVGDKGAKGYVVSIADLNDLRVELDISQESFAKISPRQKCWITTDAYPDRRYEGQLDLVSPEANRQKATVLVRVKVMNPDDLLKPDMNSTVMFLAPRPATQPATQAADGATAPIVAPAIRVPLAAIRDGAVFVVEDDKAVRRPVTLGRQCTGGEIEVRKGLIGGEDLIVRPPEALKDGDRVKLEMKS